MILKAKFIALCPEFIEPFNKKSAFTGLYFYKREIEFVLTQLIITRLYLWWPRSFFHHLTSAFWFTQFRSTTYRTSTGEKIFILLKTLESRSCVEIFCRTSFQHQFLERIKLMTRGLWYCWKSCGKKYRGLRGGLNRTAILNWILNAFTGDQLMPSIKKL